MAKIGYARVSTRSQNDDSQIDELTGYGCDKIFTDTASGKNAARPEFDKALAYLREGDVFVITRLSRAMRSLQGCPHPGRGGRAVTGYRYCILATMRRKRWSVKAREGPR